MVVGGPPLSRKPAHTSQPLPWPNCYHPTMHGFELRAPTEVVDYSLAAHIDLMDAMYILMRSEEDMKRLKALAEAKAAGLSPPDLVLPLPPASAEAETGIQVRLPSDGECAAVHTAATPSQHDRATDKVDAQSHDDSASDRSSAVLGLANELSGDDVHIEWIDEEGEALAELLHSTFSGQQKDANSDAESEDNDPDRMQQLFNAALWNTPEVLPEDDRIFTPVVKITIDLSTVTEIEDLNDIYAEFSALEAYASYPTSVENHSFPHSDLGSSRQTMLVQRSDLSSS